MNRSFFIFIFLFVPFLGITQDACPCCTSNHQQFDFWEGDWIVHDTLGQLQGENTLTKLEDGCILNENWRGASGYTGRSYNYFDTSDSTWNQLWIDKAGSILKLKGKSPKPGLMVLQDEFQNSPQGIKIANRITWTLQENKTVSQKWDIINQDGDVLSCLFLGIYSKKI